MNFESKNVIQVGSDSDGIVVATNFEREQPQIPTSGYAQLFHIIRTQVVCLMAVLFSFVAILFENLLNVAKFLKIYGKSRIFVITILSTLFWMGHIPPVFAQSSTPELTIGAKFDTLDDSRPVIVGTSSSTHGPEDGTLTIYKKKTNSLTFEVSEIALATTTGTQGTNLTTVNGFQTYEWGANLTYGKWYIENSDFESTNDPDNTDYHTVTRRIRFVPDSMGINGLVSGAVVYFSQIDVSIRESTATSTVVKSESITINLRRYLGIAISSSTTSINEGERISFRITSDFTPVSPGFLDISLEFTANESTTILPTTSVSGVYQENSNYRISAGTNHKDLVYQTNIDQNSVDDVQVTISIVPNLSGGITVGKQGSKQIVVSVNNVSPIAVSISKSDSLTSINEGESFEIMLTATPAPTTALPVTLTTSDNVGYFNRFDPSQIMIPTTGELTVRVYTNVLPATTPSLTFRVSVGSDLTNTDTNLRYAPATGSGFVDVVILNSNKPVVQITSTANDSSVVESTAFTFTLMATPAPATNEVLTVTLTLDPSTTPYLDANFILTYDIDSSGMLDVTVPTNLVDPGTSGDTIELEIVENTDLYLIGDDYEKIAFDITKIANADKSVISITSDSDGESIGESKGFMFRLRANKTLETDLDVNLTISDSGFIEPDLTNPFRIPTSGTLDVDVMTQAKIDSNEGGEVKISIAEHSSYHISGRENQISITILNISSVASISAGDGPHTEGSTILFTITSSEPPANPVTINVMVSETDDDNILTSSPLTMRVGLSTTITTETVSFQTVKNGIHMLGGSLTVSMTTMNTEIAVGPSISVTVEDADDTPLISISTQTTSVTEGSDTSADAEITLTANNSVSNMELPITLEIDDGDHNFFANANPNPVVVNLPARERSVTHTITPENDSVQEVPGEFTVTIQTPADNTNFTVADAPSNMVRIEFVDDDISSLPEVSVTAVETEITEGDSVSASFQIAVDLTTTENLMIRYELTDSGNFLDGKAAEFSEITIGSFDFTNSVAPFSHLISNDGVEEDAGVITFKILYETSNFTYRVDAENSSAEVFVIDDDNPLPRIDISAEDSVIEGEEITFTLTATLMENATITTPLTIILEISQVGDYLTNDEGMRMVDIPTTGTMMHVERTKFLGISPANGMITATIQRETIASPTYSLGPQSRKSVNMELYVGPIVSINALSGSIVAGTPAIFDISVSSPSDTSAFDVLVNVTQTHDIIQWRIPRGVSIPAGESSRRLQIPTRNTSLQGDVSITIVFRESSDYRFRPDTLATVMVTRGNPPAELGPRISVADIAVNAILNLNSEDTGSPAPQSAFAENVQPVVSIQATEHFVAEGQPVQFSIRTQMTSVRNLVVNINISGGQSFVNISSPNQQVQIFNGQSNTIFALDTDNDDLAEEDETVIVTIVEGEGYSIASPPSNQATTLVSDANDRAKYNQRLSTANSILIPELMATTSVQSYQTMSNRVQMAFTNEEQFLFEVGGQSNPTEILKLGGQSLNEQVDLRELLRDDTEIAINLSSDNAVLNNTTAWLKSENQNIYNLNHTDSTAWSGDFYSGNYGIDFQLGSGLLLGIASSISENDISLATEQTQEFQYTARYNGFNPYIAVNSPALNTQVWVSSNISSGYIDVDSENQQTHRFDSQYSTMTFGGESRLLSSDNSILDGISELNLTSQGWIAQQSIFGDGHFTSDLATSGHNIQVSLTGSHEFDITESGTLKPNVLVGIQTAKNDTEKVSGLEVGFGTTYSNFQGLTLEGFGRGFKGREQQDYATTFTGSLNYNPNSENIGSQIKISPSWGHSATGTQLSLWQSNLTDDSNLFNHFSNGLQVKTEFSYGINLLDGIGIITPFSAIDYSGSNLFTYNIGNQFEIGNNSSFKVIGTHEIRNTNIINNKLQLQGIVRW